MTNTQKPPFFTASERHFLPLPNAVFDRLDPIPPSDLPVGYFRHTLSGDHITRLNKYMQSVREQDKLVAVLNKRIRCAIRDINIVSSRPILFSTVCFHNSDISKPWTSVQSTHNISAPTLKLF